MATVVDYDYIQEISTQEALHNMTSDVTTGYDTEIPGVNTYKINASTSTYNFPEGGGGSGIAGWSTNVSWTASDRDTVSWGSGSIYLPDGTTLSVTSGNTGNMSATTYIYYDQESNTVSYTTSASSAVGENKILLCVAAPVSSSSKKATFQAFGSGDQSTFITADNIAANTITGNEIQANSISANELSVSQLSAISANLGNITAGDITGTTITAGSTTNGAGVKLYPSSNTRGTIDFYYNGYLVGYIQGSSSNLSGRTIELYGTKYLTGGTTYSSSPLYCAGTLRIPVGTDLYDY